jgi:RNA polymerase sigma factor (sigma-70 family)
VKDMPGAKQEPDGALAAALDALDHRLAIEILVAQHGDHIYGYCRRMLGTDIEADDISQNVFAQAFQSLTDLVQVQNPRAWLSAIARHRCLDHLKARRRGPEIVGDAELHAAADSGLPGTPAVEQDPRVRKALDECLDRLDARSRALLVLRFYDELSYDDIGKLTSDTPGALRVRLARALPMLRRCLEHKGVQL